jgi:hypothetical protein
MKEYQKHIIVIFLLSSPIWGYFLFKEGLAYFLAGSRIYSFTIEPSTTNEALLVTTGALMSSETHLVTRTNGEEDSLTYVGSLSGNEAGHFCINIVTSKDGEIIAVQSQVKPSVVQVSPQEGYVWTHAYDFSSKKAVGIDYGHYSSDPDIWTQRHHYIRDLVNSHGGSGQTIRWEEYVSKIRQRVPWRKWRHWNRWIKQRRESGEHRASIDAAVRRD